MYYTAKQKLEIINEYFMSNLSVYKFSQLKGLGKVTLARWLEIYRKENPDLFTNDYVPVLNEIREQIVPNESNKEKQIMTTKDIPILFETNESNTEINEISLSINDINLKFDIKNLKQVLEVLK